MTWLAIVVTTDVCGTSNLKPQNPHLNVVAVLRTGNGIVVEAVLQSYVSRCAYCHVS